MRRTSTPSASATIVQEIAENQPPPDAHRHVRLGVDHRGPHPLEHLAVHLAGGLGDDVGHPQLDHQHGGEDAHVDLLADADGHRAAVLHAVLLEAVSLRLSTTKA